MSAAPGDVEQTELLAIEMFDAIAKIDLGMPLVDLSARLKISDAMTAIAIEKLSSMREQCLRVLEEWSANGFPQARLIARDIRALPLTTEPAR